MGILTEGKLKKTLVIRTYAIGNKVTEISISRAGSYGDDSDTHYAKIGSKNFKILFGFFNLLNDIFHFWGD